ncbi:dTDP-4-dehydrorhamnose 3,5-epimerase family protein [Candidatus Roizmanbacteria bacterium]|nr:dTDP-4-dehydrorhamnose 3,5-epimerase family protein [Candidatus Roizmanbacteria bacterium]
MKILEVKTLIFPEVKVIKFSRFGDERGYFSELFRQSDFQKNNETSFYKNAAFVQVNESFSRKNVIRGLHFQWNPYMGKLVRTVHGHMVDMILDIRLNSPTFGKIIVYDMPASPQRDFNEWIWIPVGFAHGNFFLAETIIEYFCTGEYNSNSEAGISPLSLDLDWSLCSDDLKKNFDAVRSNQPLISRKDRNGYTLAQWKNDEKAKNFLYKSRNST